MPLGAGRNNGERPRSKASKALEEFVELRKDKAHGCTPGCYPRRHLDQVKALVRRITQALLPLKDERVFSLESAPKTRRGFDAHFNAYSGRDVEAIRITLPDSPDLIERVPFLLSQAGAVFYLEPFVSISGDRASLLLLNQWTDQPSYRSSSGQLIGLDHELDWKSAHAFGSNCKPAARDSLDPDLTEQLPRDPFSREQPKVKGYRILGRLGLGSTGTVWHARRYDDAVARGDVALKIFHSTAAKERRQLKRLEREFTALASLEHPRIVKVLDYSLEEAYLCTELVEGQNLQAYVEARNLTYEQAVTLCKDVLEGLEHAHSRKVLHRDVKPSNVMVTRNGAVLIDFGVARGLLHEDITRTVDTVGSLRFAAPEQYEGKGKLGPECDLYALGQVLNFCVESIATNGESCPPGLSAVIQRATQSEPSYRYQTSRSMIEDLESQALDPSGPPLANGTAFNGSYVVVDYVGEQAGLHGFHAIEIETQDVVSLLVGDCESPDLKSFKASLKRASPQTKSSADLSATLRSDNGLLCFVFRGRDPISRALSVQRDQHFQLVGGDEITDGDGTLQQQIRRVSPLERLSDLLSRMQRLVFVGASVRDLGQQSTHARQYFERRRTLRGCTQRSAPELEDSSALEPYLDLAPSTRSDGESESGSVESATAALNYLANWAETNGLEHWRNVVTKLRGDYWIREGLSASIAAYRAMHFSVKEKGSRRSPKPAISHTLRPRNGSTIARPLTRPVVRSIFSS